jgi:hypothetical protein
LTEKPSITDPLLLDVFVDAWSTRKHCQNQLAEPFWMAIDASRLMYRIAVDRTTDGRQTSSDLERSVSFLPLSVWSAINPVIDSFQHQPPSPHGALAASPPPSTFPNSKVRAPLSLKVVIPNTPLT